MRNNRSLAIAGRDGVPEWQLLERSRAVAAVVMTASGTILDCNGAFSRLTVGSRAAVVVGSEFRDLLDDARAWERLLPGKPATEQTVELTLRPRDERQVVLRGEIVELSGDAGESRLLGLFTDGTEFAQMRRAMQRGARLEALGSLTSGVAHDFNNLLTVLVGNLALAAEELRDQPKTFSKLKSARDAATRGAELIRQLLAFAKQEEVDGDLINPARVVEKIVPLLSRAMGSKIELSLSLDENAATVRGNAAQLESVIVNLTVNARDAIENGGKVTIDVCNLDLVQKDADRLSLKPGPHVRLRVSDNGAGIPADKLAHVFEPFFTTKGDSGGTGLGLSMVEAYARQHRGAATIESRKGEGTRVSLLFPCSGDALEDSIAMTMPLQSMPSGDESVLVIAPEEALTATVAQILSVLGYDIRTTVNLGEANDLMRGQRFDLVIVDGYELSPILSALSRNGQAGAPAKVMRLNSGTDARELDEVPGVNTLLKPFSLADLAQAVRDSLES